VASRWPACYGLSKYGLAYLFERLVWLRAKRAFFHHLLLFRLCSLPASFIIAFIYNHLPLRNPYLFQLMRNLTSFRWLLALLLAVGSLATAQASHIQGGDISFASIASTIAGVPRYRVTVRSFSDGTGLGMRTSIPLIASTGGCYTGAPNAFTVNAPLISTTTAPFVCASYNMVGLYEVDIDLPPGQWQLGYNDGARSGGIVNMSSPTSQSYYIGAFLDNTVSTQDHSPQFESLLRRHMSATATAPYSYSAFDTDGDSLRYEFVLPYSACGQTIPSTFSPHFGLNAGTGAIPPVAATSTAQGIYCTVVRVSEYRKMGANRWALLGYVTRDNLYLVDAATNLPPVFTTMQVNGGAAQPLSQPIAAQAGQTINVTLQATDPNAGQLLNFVSNAPAVVPGLTLARVGTTNSEQLTWQIPATLSPGRYNIAVGVLDDGCGSEERTLTFVVGSTALATRTAATATDVFPVPFREQVQFTTTPNQVVVLVDALGREVARLTSAPSGLVRWQPTATLPAGLYLARSASNGQALARLLRAE
jgi:hypothetical protein